MPSVDFKFWRRISLPWRFDELAERDQRILDSFAAEYERKCQEEAGEIVVLLRDPLKKIAHVVYSTG